MDRNEILTRVDHTILTPTATWDQVKKICDEGIRYNTASVCIPPRFMKDAHAYVGNKLKLCTVIGFPNGYSMPEVKVYETEDAIRHGADEIDMVINLGLAKAGDWEAVLSEIKGVKAACNGRILRSSWKLASLPKQKRSPCAAWFPCPERTISKPPPGSPPAVPLWKISSCSVSTVLPTSVSRLRAGSVPSSRLRPCWKPALTASVPAHWWA